MSPLILVRAIVVAGFNTRSVPISVSTSAVTGFLPRVDLRGGAVKPVAIDTVVLVEVGA